MKIYTLPFFGEIKINSLKKYYETEAEIEGYRFQLDLNFEQESIEKNNLNKIENFIKNIILISKENVRHYFEDYEKGGETVDYIEYYFDEFEELNEIVKVDKFTTSESYQLLQKLELIRVGIYPDAKPEMDYFGVFDYSIKIGEEFSNQLLVVKTDANGNLDHITWES